MGLPVRQRRALERIESTLRGSDPTLVALYAIFARLTRDEEMPGIEQLRRRAAAALVRIRFALAALVSRLRIRPALRPRFALFFPLAIALAVTSIVFAIRAGSGNGCTSTKTMAASKYVSNSRLCRTNNLNSITVGH